MPTAVAERLSTTRAPASERPGVSDGELIGRVAAGDIAAFEQLYARFARPILGLAQRLLGDPGRAEDAAQETFASVWRSAKSYRPDRGTGSAWLYTVARNSIIDRSRKRTEPAVDTAPDTPADAHGPPEEAEASWVAWSVHAAVQQLPENERTVVELAYWKGLSQREVAEQLDIPLGTVKTRTRTALLRLSERLEEVRP